MIVEVVGGLLAGSLAVLSDAAHLMADLAAFGVAIGANYLASLPSTSQHTYGLQRTESLAALFSMASLAVICVVLGVEACRRLYLIVTLDGDRTVEELYDVNGKLMSIIATIGVAVNIALAFVLGENHVHLPSHGDDHACGGGHDHSHSHGHSHNPVADEETSLLKASSTNDNMHHNHEAHRAPAKESRNVNLHAAYLHVLGDLAQSVAVLISGLIIWFKPGWAILDPIVTLGFCVLVLYSTLGVVRRAICVLLEEVPPHINWNKVHEDLEAVANVARVHDLHIWSISDGVICVSVHAAAVDDDCAKALERIQSVCKKHNLEHVTAQVQPASIPGCLTCGIASGNCASKHGSESSY